MKRERESESEKEKWLRILWKGTENSRKKLENEEKDREQGRSRTTLFFFLRDWFLPPSAAIEVREDN